MSREEVKASGGGDGSFFRGAFVGVLEDVSKEWDEGGGRYGRCSLKGRGEGAIAVWG
jgi:hypothetical protein